MAYAFQPLEAALDSLGVNFTDGVTVKIAEKYTINCDLSEVESLIQNTDPKLTCLHSEYDTAFEKQVLLDLAKYKEEKEKRDKDRRERIAEYDRRLAEEQRRLEEEAEKGRRRLEEEAEDQRRRLEEEAEAKRKEDEEKALEDERKHLEEIEAEKERLLAESRKVLAEAESTADVAEPEEKDEEAEWRKFELERRTSDSGSFNRQESVTNEPSQQICDNKEPVNENNPVISVSEAQMLQTNPGALQTKPQIAETVSSKSFNHVKINFSDFEAEADVFADMELQTINEFAELQSILANQSKASEQLANQRQTSNQPQASSQPTDGYQPGHNFLYNSGTVASTPLVNGFSSAGATSLSNSMSGSTAPTVISSNSQFQSSLNYPGGGPSQGYSNIASYQNNPFLPPVSQPLGAPSSSTNPFLARQYPYLPNGTETNQSYPNYFAGYTGYSGYPGGSVANSGAGPRTTMAPGPYNSRTINAGPQSTIAPSLYDSGVINAGPHTALAPGTYSAPIGLAHSRQDNYYSNQSRGGSEGHSRDSSQLREPGNRNPRSKSSERTTRPLSCDRSQEQNSSDRTIVKLNSGEEPQTGELKPSRSVGDLISELQKEARSIAEHKRKNVATPPPRPVSRGQSGLEDFVPWPNIGPADPLEGLDDPCKLLCNQLKEMGFPLHRLTRAAKSVGADSQKLINFCVLVDRLVEEGWKEDVSIDAALLHASDQTLSRQHLRGFVRLAELGFKSQDIHRALIDSGQDHQKALEQLIQ